MVLKKHIDRKNRGKRSGKAYKINRKQGKNEGIRL
jgi:hypothetical protein